MSAYRESDLPSDIPADNSDLVREVVSLRWQRWNRFYDNALDSLTRTLLNEKPSVIAERAEAIADEAYQRWLTHHEEAGRKWRRLDAK